MNRQLIKSFFCFLAIATFLVACGEPTTPKPTPNPTESSLLSAKGDSLYELVMYKHDEVMPKDNDIAAAQAQLRARLDSLPKEDKNLREPVLGLLTDLTKAHDKMWEWMNEFKNVDLDDEFYKAMNEEQTLEYLREEEKKIEHVAELMLSSLDSTDLYLSNN